MAIQTSDILFKLSTKSGSAGNTLTQADPNSSLGKYISTTQITDASLDNLFGDISGDDNAASAVDYRCFFVHNNNATLTWLGVKAWISAEVAGGANTAIALDNTSATAIGSSPAQADNIATATTSPVSVGAWSTATTKSTGITVGDIPAGYCRAIWVRRTATNSAALNNDGVSVSFAGDTTA